MLRKVPVPHTKRTFGLTRLLLAALILALTACGPGPVSIGATSSPTAPESTGTYPVAVKSATPTAGWPYPEPVLPTPELATPTGWPAYPAPLPAPVHLLPGDEPAVMLGGPATAAALQGDYAYLGIGPQLVVLDISNPEKPRLVGSSERLEGSVRGIAVKGNFAYVSGNRLQVVDISDPGSLVKGPSLALPGRPGNILAVSGELLFVSGSEHGVHLLDISEPAAPAILGYYPMAAPALSLAATGKTLFVADGDGLRIADLSDPARPASLAFLDLPGEVTGLVLNEDFLYVASGGHGLRVVDISEPAAPQETGFLVTPGDLWHISPCGRLACLLDANGRMLLADVSNPAIPELLPDRLGGFGSQAGLAGKSDLAIVVGGRAGLSLIDLRNPLDPAVVQLRLESGAGDGEPAGQQLSIPVAGNPIDVASSGCYAYLATQDGLQTIDVSSPDEPFETSFLPYPGWISGLALTEDTLYLVDGEQNLRVLDLAEPAEPLEVGSLALSNGRRGIAVGEELLLVAGELGGVLVVDVSVPEDPQEISRFETQDSVEGLAIAGDLAYLAASDRLYVLDLSDRREPLEVGRLRLSGRIVDEAGPVGLTALALYGETVYLADLQNGVWAVDVSDPAEPEALSREPLAGFAEDLVIAGEYLYAAAWEAGVAVLDLIMPEQPYVLGYFPAVGPASAIAAAGEMVYYIDGSLWGLPAFENGEPDFPLVPWPDSDTGEAPPDEGKEALELTLLGTYPRNGAAVLAIEGTLVFLGAGADLVVLETADPAAIQRAGENRACAGEITSLAVGEKILALGCREESTSALQLVEISAPGQAAFAGSIDLPGQVQAIRIEADQAAVVTGDAGLLLILDLSDPAKPEILGGYDTYGTVQGLARRGDLAFVAHSAGLQVLDLTDPAEPERIANYPEGDRGWLPPVVDVALEGSLAYLAMENAGLQILDVLDPRNPAELGFYTPVWPVRKVVSCAHYACLAAGESLEVVDVTYPAWPRLAAKYDLPEDMHIMGMAYAEEGGEGRIFLATEEGLVILRMAGR
jgi:hypothetical protein